jgi:hypothetical protein
MVTLECARIADPRLEVIDYLARLKLELRRGGHELRLAHADVDLLRLLEFVGLADVLCVEVQWQPEQREEPGRVEEEGELADPAT